ncbi:MAG: hypothetical protein BWY75_02850 [bacterium ADurb.Bin425]|nr:MAG: hypothetical protein BWY75_02850 [bacterium ADurb.Bin425]
MFASEHATGATHTGLYFVKNKKDAFLTGNLTHLTQIASRRNVDTAFALNRFKNYSRCIFINSRFDGLGITERNMNETIEKRFEGFTKNITSGG